MFRVAELSVNGASRTTSLDFCLDKCSDYTCAVLSVGVKVISNLSSCLGCSPVFPKDKLSTEFRNSIEGLKGEALSKKCDDFVRARFDAKGCHPSQQIDEDGFLVFANVEKVEEVRDYLDAYLGDVPGIQIALEKQLKMAVQ